MTRQLAATLVAVGVLAAWTFLVAVPLVSVICRVVGLECGL